MSSFSLLIPRAFASARTWHPGEAVLHVEQFSSLSENNGHCPGGSPITRRAEYLPAPHAECPHSFCFLCWLYASPDIPPRCFSKKPTMRLTYFSRSSK